MFGCDQEFGFSARDGFGAWYGVYIWDRRVHSLVEVCAPTAATLTPEEARFFARQIMLAADECETVRAQHITEGIVG